MKDRGKMQQICRTCMATHGELVPIFTNNYYVHNLPDKLKHIIKIEVSKDDDLPQMICKKCVFLVDSLYCFKDQCEMVEVKLKKSLLKNQVNNTNKLSRSCDLSLTKFESSRDEDNSDAVSSSEDEYHIEYVSEEARLAVEGAKRLRRNAKKKRSLHSGVKVKSVEVLPTESKSNSSKNIDKLAKYNYNFSEINEETNVTDSDISSSCCTFEDSKKLPNKNDGNKKWLKQGFKRRLDLDDSYNQLTKVPKKVMFKDSEYDDENTQYIEVTENPKAQKELKPNERTLPSTKIDSNILNKKIRSFKTSNNSMASTEISKSAVDSSNKKLYELRMENLIKHVILKNPKSCTICSDSFDTYLSMLRHKISMHMNPDEQSFYCPVCQEKVFSHKLLLKHLDNHKDIHSFMCVLCSENFYTTEQMRSHLTSHVDLNELTCILCKVKFERIATLISHIDIHVNKMLVCSFCIDSFDSKDSLQNHLNEEHEVSIENKNPIPLITEKKKSSRFPCLHCKRNFASESALRDHITQKHQEFACLVCDKKFPTQDERNEHTKQCHMKADTEQTVQTPPVDRKKFLCRVCHEILVSRVVYSQHLKEKHCSPNLTNDGTKEQSDTNQQSTKDGFNSPASETT
ncbi:zinc finger and BTB domain-containing protein 24-like [Phymastichus coffea]|uniref:zinc finger and BTB domain-containing protein 24-like n=1 Tax=Phymastichus coffea TaxID=108790 RepID=UPI00273C25DA|nr:zinc finger and BTB domain-containing protein 24-like [Phymastichus coffea]XP_058793858.1 zinc finger and BTB domain-containing protein 24-like [Phymastichus coffea]XP_058793859.1 zinc finger and BTB domain-containing protein 24-like [Phymastichus coffea]XP_058793860.1 zinc finger and BTB domain-containing protein 24-like [Phymastichus coffea]